MWDAEHGGCSASVISVLENCLLFCAWYTPSLVPMLGHHQQHKTHWLLALLIDVNTVNSRMSFTGSIFLVFLYISLPPNACFHTWLLSPTWDRKRTSAYSCRNSTKQTSLCPLKQDHPGQLFILCFQANYGEKALINNFFSFLFFFSLLLRLSYVFFSISCGILGPLSQ